MRLATLFADDAAPASKDADTKARRDAQEGQGDKVSIAFAPEGGKEIENDEGRPKEGDN